MYFPVARLLAVPTVLLWVGCGGATTSEPEAEYRPCLHNGSEFPPSACAQLVGTLRVPAGQRADTFVVIVDTADAASLSWYIGPPSSVRADGHFEILVVQVEPLGAPPPRDRHVRTLELRVHRTADQARTRTNVLSRHLVTMVFTPWGQLVEPTGVSVSFDTP